MDVEAIDLETLALFAAVAETASFTRGAARVFRTQPVASNRIAGLERALGAALFNREGASVRLTAAGETLYGYAKRLLALRAEALEAIGRAKGEVAGDLAIGASTIPATYLVPRWAARFHKRFPKVRLRVAVHATADVIRRVHDGELDFGVVGDRAASAQVHCVSMTGAGDEIVLAVPARHALARARGPLAPQDLKKQPLVLRGAGSGTRSVLERVLRRVGMSLSRDCDVICEVDSTEAAREAVKAGIGIAFLSALAVAGPRACREVVVRRLAGVDLHRPFYLVTPKNRKLTRAARAFVEIARGRG